MFVDTSVAQGGLKSPKNVWHNIWAFPYSTVHNVPSKAPQIGGYIMWIMEKDMLNPKKPEEAPGNGPWR